MFNLKSFPKQYRPAVAKRVDFTFERRNRVNIFAGLGEGADILMRVVDLFQQKSDKGLDRGVIEFGEKFFEPLFRHFLTPDSSWCITFSRLIKTS